MEHTAANCMNNTPFELHFSRTNGLPDAAIDQLMAMVGDIQHPDIVREMIIAALKAGQETTDKGDLKLMNTSLKEMRFTTKVFGPYRHAKKVTVFGSARTRPTEPIYRSARLFGSRLAQKGYMVITGGGGGIMQAVNEGAGLDHSFGVNIRLPFEQQPNDVIKNSPRSITYKYFFNRKVAFLKEADAVALFPGGFGTLDEAMETLTLLQTGKRDPMPLVLVDEPGCSYWSRFLDFIQKELAQNGYVSAPDLDLIDVVCAIEEAVERIDFFYKRYHSLRYVGKELVMRLSSPLNARQIAQLTQEFSDILTPQGSFRPSGPLPAEDDEPELAHLPRLVIDFNRMSFGRLHTLINFLNRL